MCRPDDQIGVLFDVMGYYMHVNAHTYVLLIGDGNAAKWQLSFLVSHETL